MLHNENDGTVLDIVIQPMIPQESLGDVLYQNEILHIRDCLPDEVDSRLVPQDGPDFPDDLGKIPKNELNIVYGGVSAAIPVGVFVSLLVRWIRRYFSHRKRQGVKIWFEDICIEVNGYKEEQTQNILSEFYKVIMSKRTRK